MPEDPNDTLIATATALLGIEARPEWLPAIRLHLDISLGHAANVASFLLPDEAEPAPVFRA